MKGNLVHTYITGFKFDNIYGGQSDDRTRTITQIKYLTPLAAQRWPWIKNKWHLYNGRNCFGYFNTLKEAKARAQELWPGCGFKTRKQIIAEIEKNERTNSRTC